MQALSKKLQSESGASILLALLLLLVGIVVSAVIVASALSAMQSLDQDRTEQQVYLEVSSAAELVRDELESGACDYTSTVTNVYTKYSKWGSYGNPTTTTYESFGTGAFSAITKEALTYLEDYPGSTFSHTYTISAAEHDDVSAEITLVKSSENTDNYNMKIVFSGGKDNHKCKMILTMEGITTTNSNSSESSSSSWLSTTYTKTEIVTTTIKWQNADIQRKEVQ